MWASSGYIFLVREESRCVLELLFCHLWNACLPVRTVACTPDGSSHAQYWLQKQGEAGMAQSMYRLRAWGVSSNPVLERRDQPWRPPSVVSVESNLVPPEVKGPEHEALHSPPSRDEVKNKWSYTTTPPSTFLNGLYREPYFYVFGTFTPQTVSADDTSQKISACQQETDISGGTPFSESCVCKG